MPRTLLNLLVRVMFNWAPIDIGLFVREKIVLRKVLSPRGLWSTLEFPFPVAMALEGYLKPRPILAQFTWCSLLTT